MSRDFRTDRVRTTQIIAENAGPVQKAQIIVYPSQSATNYTSGFTPSLVTTVGTDAFLFVSGTIFSRGTGSSYGTSLFGGDLVASGTILAERGLSGSLTRLADGTSYLVAGANITINSSSNGQVVISSLGSTVSNYFTDPSSGFLNTTGSLSLAGGLGGSHTTANVGTDVFFYVSGSDGSRGTATRGTAVFGGDVYVSGSSYFGSSNTDAVYFNAKLSTDIVPDGDRTRNLGASGARFANIYTGDLHLRNDKGDWTIVEEEDFLCVVNNKTGKRYKMMLQPLD